MFSQLVAGVYALTMLGVRCSDLVEGNKEKAESYEHRKVLSGIKDLLVSLESIVERMRVKCSEIHSYERQIDREIVKLLSPDCPVNNGAINGITSRIWKCVDRASKQLITMSGNPTYGETPEQSLDNIDNLLVETRNALNGSSGCSRTQGGDLSGIGTEKPGSAQAGATIQPSAPSSSGNPDVSDASTSLKTADTHASVGPVPSLQGSYGRVLAFVSECSRRLRAELGLIKEHEELFEECIMNTLRLLFPSNAMDSTPDARAESLRTGAMELQGEYGTVRKAIEESLKSINGLGARVRKERDAFDQALVARPGSTN
ncbi:hypothetical protein PAPHI01_1658 [Pancytospora philotis]|nr:hypothetical protein PAPHI01_1658 [Pancytospora philotis]